MINGIKSFANRLSTLAIPADLFSLEKREHLSFGNTGVFGDKALIRECTNRTLLFCL